MPVAKRRTCLGVDWHMPDGRGGFRARRFATTTAASSLLISVLAGDGHTVQSARDAINYDDEAKDVLTQMVDAGFGADRLDRYVRPTDTSGTTATFGAMRPIFTKLLDNRQSHLAQHLKTAYPETLRLRQAVRAGAGDIIVEPGDANAGTIGTAFDMLSGILLVENHVPLSPGPTRGWRPVHGILTGALTGMVHDTQSDRATNDDFYKAIWVLAELGSIVRSGYSNPEGALEQVIAASSGFDALLGIAPADGIRQLRELEQVASDHLYPHMHDPVTLSASFPAFQDVVQAESDIIADGILLDFKTGAGAPHKATGARAFFPTDADIYQILGYALMDEPKDGHGIDALGLYAARYGFSTVWELPQLLGILAGGHAVNLDAARSSFRSALEADYEAATLVVTR